jgi:hypothetical protein
MPSLGNPGNCSDVSLRPANRDTTIASAAANPTDGPRSRVIRGKGSCQEGVAVRRTVWLGPLLFILLSLGCKGALPPASHAPATDITATPCPAQTAISAKQAYAIARAWAQGWDSGSHLVTVAAGFGNEQFDMGPERYYFDFAAEYTYRWGPFGPWQKWHTGTAVIDARCGRIIFTLQGWTTRPFWVKAFDLDTVALDSTDALRVTEVPGGAAYRESFADCSIDIEGRTETAYGPTWWVTYGGPGYSIVFRVDATTGKWVRMRMSN